MSEENGKANELNEDFVLEKVRNGFVLKGLGGAVGEITYQLVDGETWNIDHTYVDPNYRGHNFARQLLDSVVEEARLNGKKIIPSCSYALAQFKRNPQYADVWKKDTK